MRTSCFAAVRSTPVSSGDFQLDKLNLREAYTRWVDRSKKELAPREAMHHAIGGEFEAFGTIEAEMLKYFGLLPQHVLVDVGCGSGRLASKLGGYLTGGYLGTDIVADLVDHARSISHAGAGWRFQVVDGLRIPGQDGAADMVCFFSVLTHLLHEQSYLYLEEAKRVLKPGGTIVFSFLEFRLPSHWAAFDATVRDERLGNEHPLNVFIERDAIKAWAQMLNLEVIHVIDGIDAFVPLPQPVVLDSGEVISGTGRLGQSICVLRT